MTVDHFLVNSEVLRALYSGEVPLLRHARLRSVNLNWRGPTVTLRVDLPSYPDSAPREWLDEGVDTVQCQLQFLAAENIVLAEWRPPVSVSIDVIHQESKRRIAVGVRGHGISLDFVSSDAVLVGHVSAFKKSHEGSDDGRHLFTRKIDSIRHSSIPSPDEKSFYEHL